MPELKFSKTHEWVLVEADTARIGISDYAQKELGDAVYVELPKVGDKVSRSAHLGNIESTKTVGELFSPLTGEVVEVNDNLTKEPGLINKDPLGRGWIAKIKVVNPEEAGLMMDEPAYNDFISGVKH